MRGVGADLGARGVKYARLGMENGPTGQTRSGKVPARLAVCAGPLNLDLGV